MTRIKLAIAPIVAGMLICIAALFNGGTLHAQCNSILATNNLRCDIQLCLYSATGVVVCRDIPAGATIPLVFTAPFTPVGALSQNSIRHPFVNATGCTDCFQQITTSTVPCCGMVCFDPQNCTITVSPCTSTICNP